MPTRAIALLSGGLDSMLAIRILQEQAIEVEALNFRTLFTCCGDDASRSAQRLGVRLTVIGTEDEAYLDLIRRPRFGFGRGANPCVDCRIYMFELARRYMEETGAAMVVSGEVIGQRPMSQKRRDLLAIEQHSNLEGRLLRPLSAKLLPRTIPEQEGIVDRAMLYDFNGRGRKGLIALAKSFGFEDAEIPSPSTGCMLTEPNFATRVHDLVELDAENTAWDFELLKLGRHLRFDPETKVVVGRREAENVRMESLFARADARAAAFLRADNFKGPATMLIGPPTEAAIHFAAGLLLRFSKSDDVAEPTVELEFSGGEKSLVTVARDQRAMAAATL